MVNWGYWLNGHPDEQAFIKCLPMVCLQPIYHLLVGLKQKYKKWVHGEHRQVIWRYSNLVTCIWKSTKQSGIRKLGNVSPIPQNMLGDSLVISPVPSYTDRSNLGNLSHSVMAGRGKCNLVSRLPGKSTFPLAFSWRKSGQLFWQLKECSAQ